jgi:urea transporter
VLTACLARAWETPVFTFPFHIATWTWLLGSQKYHHFANDLAFPVLVNVTTGDNREFADLFYDNTCLLLALLKGIGQVLFLESAVGGNFFYLNLNLPTMMMC